MYILYIYLYFTAVKKKKNTLPTLKKNGVVLGTDVTILHGIFLFNIA